MLDYFKKRLLSFKYALRGINLLCSEQANAKIHLSVSIVVIITALILRLNTIEFCLILFCIVMVIAAEAFNSALEYLADRVEPNKDPLIEKSKDLAAAAVLICSIGAAVVGLIIFLPKIQEFVLQ